MNLSDINPNNPNHIFVFGSNTEGRHGKGQALHATIYHKAKRGQAHGLQGNCYAICTKDLAKGARSIPLWLILAELEELAIFAEQNKHLTFFVNKIGTGNAGYTNQEIKGLMDKIAWPENCVLPDW